MSASATSSNRHRGAIRLALWLVLGGAARAAGAPPDAADAYAAERLGSAAIAASLPLPPDLAEEFLRSSARPGTEAPIRYWQEGRRRVWLIRGRGRSRPLEAAFCIERGAIIDARVLVYQESRGHQAAAPGYLRHFRNVRLVENALSRRVDVVSGATITSRVLAEMARLALLLDRASLP